MPYTSSKNTSPIARKPKKVLVLLAIILLVAAAGVYIVTRTSKSPIPSSQTTSGPTKEQQDHVNTDNAEKKLESAQKEGTSTAAGTPNELTSSNLSLTANQNSDNTVTVITSLKSYSDGTCELTATNGAAQVVQNADVIYQSDASSCAGFSIPITQLGVGTWQIVLKVTSGGVTNQQSISHEVR